MYEYRARVVRVIDGDTLALAVDLGCDVTVSLTVRLYGVNCPEMKGDTRILGGQAKAFTVDWLNSHSDEWDDFALHTYKDRREKYGRYLGEIYRGDHSLNDALVEAGHAVRVEY